MPLERASDEAYLPHSRGDANNAILAAADYDFRLLIKRLRISFLFAILARPKSAVLGPKPRTTKPAPLAHDIPHLGAA